MPSRLHQWRLWLNNSGCIKLLQGKGRVYRKRGGSNSHLTKVAGSELGYSHIKDTKDILLPALKKPEKKKTNKTVDISRWNPLDCGEQWWFRVMSAVFPGWHQRKLGLSTRSRRFSNFWKRCVRHKSETFSYYCVVEGVTAEADNTLRDLYKFFIWYDSRIQ